MLGIRESRRNRGGQVWGNPVRVTDTTYVTESRAPGTGSIYNLFFNFVYPCKHLLKHLTFKNSGPYNHYLSWEKMRLIPLIPLLRK